MAIFCEGTRFTEDKYEEGIEYARRMGVQPLKHHLMPRTKGYAILAESLKKDGKIRELLIESFAVINEISLEQFDWPDASGSHIANVVL